MHRRTDELEEIEADRRRRHPDPEEVELFGELEVYVFGLLKVVFLMLEVGGFGVFEVASTTAEGFEVFEVRLARIRSKRIIPAAEGCGGALGVVWLRSWGSVYQGEEPDADSKYFERWRMQKEDEERGSFCMWVGEKLI